MSGVTFEVTDFLCERYDLVLHFFSSQSRAERYDGGLNGSTKR